MDELAPQIRKLGAVLDALEMNPIKLPPMAVIGSVGHGKTSLVESLLGLSFLPSPSRLPIIIHLHQNDDDDKEYAELYHVSDQRYYDFDAVKQGLVNETNRILGQGISVGVQALHVKVVSPRLPTMTIADLPGLPQRNKAPDTFKAVADICKKFLKVPDCIILSVTDATTDLANSYAILLASKMDPGNTRTISVLTNMDKVSTANSELLPGLLKDGKFFGVANPKKERDFRRVRTISTSSSSSSTSNDTLFGGSGTFGRFTSFLSDDTSSSSNTTNDTSSNAFADQDEGYDEDPQDDGTRSITYAAPPSAKIGLEYISAAVNGMLLHPLRDLVPEIKVTINGLIGAAQREFQQYRDDPKLQSQKNHGALLLSLITAYVGEFQDAIDCKSEESIKQGQNNELYGGARLSYIFRDQFQPILSEIDSRAIFTRQELRTVVRNARGVQPTLLAPMTAFELLIKRMLLTLEEPVDWCIESVGSELVSLSALCAEKKLNRYPILQERVTEFVKNIIYALQKPTFHIIHDYLNMELAYFNPHHPDFGGYIATITRELYGEPDQQSSNPGQQQQGQQGQQLSDWQAVEWNSSGDLVTDSVGGSGGNDNQGQKNNNGNGNGNEQEDNNEWANTGNGKTEQVEERNAWNQSSSSRTSSSSSSTGDMGVYHQRVPHSITVKGDPSDEELLQIQVIEAALLAYFDVIRAKVHDTVPKSIMAFLVNRSKEGLLSELVAEFYDDSLFEELLKEAEDFQKKRDECLERIKRLRDLLLMTQEVADLDYQF